MHTPHARATSTTSPALAVVTVTHNSSHVIGRWLESLERTGRRAQMELCVVDNGSHEAELARMTEILEGRVDRFQMCANLGYGRSCNVGARLTTAPALLFTNPDCLILTLPEDAVLDDLGRCILGPMLMQPGGDPVPQGFDSFPTVAHEVRDLILGRWRRKIGFTAAHPAWVTGAALLMARPDFTALGGFSSELFMYFEDADLCARHQRAGGSVAVNSGFVIAHQYGRSSLVEDQDRLDSARESVNRLSARWFAARYGRGWYRPVLYGLLIVAYIPRRLVSALMGRRGRRGRALFYALDILTPQRVMRRLGAPHRVLIRSRTLRRRLTMLGIGSVTDA